MGGKGDVVEARQWFVICSHMQWGASRMWEASTLGGKGDVMDLRHEQAIRSRQQFMGRTPSRPLGPGPCCRCGPSSHP